MKLCDECIKKTKEISDMFPTLPPLKAEPCCNYCFFRNLTVEDFWYLVFGFGFVITLIGFVLFLISLFFPFYFINKFLYCVTMYASMLAWVGAIFSGGFWKQDFRKYIK